MRDTPLVTVSQDRKHLTRQGPAYQAKRVSLVDSWEGVGRETVEREKYFHKARSVDVDILENSAVIILRSSAKVRENAIVVTGLGEPGTC